MNLSVNMETVRTMGKTVSDQAAEYNNEITNIYAAIDAVKSVWQGSDSASYTSQVEGYRASMEALGKVIEQYGQFLLNTADTYTKLQEDITSNAGKL